MAERREVFDVIVVGGGPAGLSAALMLGRCRRRILVCDAGQPRNRRSHALHGYLTRDGVAPADFNAQGRRELTPYGVDFREISVQHVDRHGNAFLVRLADGREERARFLLLATGVVDELPPIDGVDACYGRSVFHCPYCDGWEWRDRRLGVVGRGTHATSLALSLRTWSGDLLLCTNGSRVPSGALAHVRRNGIAIRSEPIDRLDHVDGMVTALRFRSGGPAPLDAVFFSTPQHPQCDLAVRLGCAFNRRGTVNTGALSDTNVPGVFVAGDASHDAQFVVVAAAEGVKAALAINQALQREEVRA